MLSLVNVAESKLSLADFMKLYNVEIRSYPSPFWFFHSFDHCETLLSLILLLIVNCAQKSENWTLCDVQLACCGLSWVGKLKCLYEKKSSSLPWLPYLPRSMYQLMSDLGGDYMANFSLGWKSSTGLSTFFPLPPFCFVEYSVNAPAQTHVSTRAEIFMRASTWGFSAFQPRMNILSPGWKS